MNKKILSLLTILLFSLGFAQCHIETLEKELFNPNYISVASHRGDWRNAPENSIQAMLNVAKMGVNISEMDLGKTKDGVLVLIHDKTIDRTMTGKGKPGDYTLAELKKMWLRAGQGRPTSHKIPTLEEYLNAAKGKILIGVDKGYPYFNEVIDLLRKTGTLQQAIVDIHDNTTLDEVEAKYGKVADDIILMPIVIFKGDGKAEKVINSYLRHKKTIFQMVWKDDKYIKNADFHKLVKMGYPVWLNSLWPSLCGGHDDDKAVEQGLREETWGWLIEKGATIIQTDRPKELLEYLKAKGLRE